MAVHGAIAIVVLSLSAVYITAAPAISLSALAAAADTKLITFVFGDSLTDVGNNNHLQYSLAKSNYPWYGVDYKTGQPTGRFSNGRTIGDIVSAKLGTQPPPPYLSLSPNDDAILKGVNYASGGAGILNETGFYFLQKLSFDDQISSFETTRTAIVSKIGEEAAEKLCNEALYFIGLGSNDYVNNYLQPFLLDAQTYSHDAFVELLMTTLNGQLRRLYARGARKMVFHGLAPLGCIPSQRVKSKNGQCLERVNAYIKEFNSHVQKLLVSLNGELPGAQLSFADSYQVVMDLIVKPQAYGFKISNTSCCNVDTSVGGLCLPSSQLCNNRRDYVFWDAFHPSDAANQVIADCLFSNPHIQQAPSSAPVPAPP